MKKFLSAAGLALAAFLSAPMAQATPITTSIASFDNGWYGANGFHSPGNTNVFTGRGSGYDTRSFFAFNLGGLGDVTILSAAIAFRPGNGTYRVNGGAYLRLYDVTTAATQMLTGGGYGAYNDLGNGAVYATRSFSTGYGAAMPAFGMGLSGTAVSRMNSTLDGGDKRFLIGAALMNNLGNPGEGLWYGSNGTSAARLTITYEENEPPVIETPAVPLPASIPLLLGALASFSLIRRRR